MMYQKMKACLNLEEYYNHVENDGSYFVLPADGGRVLNVYFEWSNGKLDWKHNFMFPAKPYRKMKNMWFCHRGFLKVWKSIEPHIVDQLLDPKVEEIHIVGYSHGGAIAQLCYEYVRFNRPEIKVTGVGFGAPRVFWGFASKAVKKRFEGFAVIRNGRDIVTHLPPTLFGFYHVADLYEIGESKNIVDDHRSENYLAALEDIESIEDLEKVVERIDYDFSS
jgi:hypothetical protein